VELVRRNNDAYNRRDVGAYLETVSESVSFRSRFSVMDNRGYRGHEELRRYFVESRGIPRRRLHSRGGRIVQIDAYPTHAEALEAAGLSE
jgi:hypothetical protein